MKDYYCCFIKHINGNRYEDVMSGDVDPRDEGSIQILASYLSQRDSYTGW